MDLAVTSYLDHFKIFWLTEWLIDWLKYFKEHDIKSTNVHLQEIQVTEYPISKLNILLEVTDCMLQVSSKYM